MALLRVVAARPGWRLGLRRGLLVAEGPEGERHEVPLSEVDLLLISSRGVVVSTNLLMALAERGVRVYLVRGDGRAVAVVAPAEATRTADSQVAQAEWRADPGRRLRAASWFVRYKLEARAWLLKYLASSRGVPALREAGYEVERWASRAPRADSIDGLREVEAHAGRVYWDAVRRHVVPPELGFPGRRPRGGDPVNAALDYLYGILRAEAHKALTYAGLNPYMGFMHVERSGRPSLTLDFMEPYRWAFEKLLYTLLARGHRPALVDGALDREYRRLLASRAAEALEDRQPGFRVTLSQAIQRDAWALAKALREGGEWRPTMPGW